MAFIERRGLYLCRQTLFVQAAPLGLCNHRGKQGITHIQAAPVLQY